MEHQGDGTTLENPCKSSVESDKIKPRKEMAEEIKEEGKEITAVDYLENIQEIKI